MQIFFNNLFVLVVGYKILLATAVFLGQKNKKTLQELCGCTHYHNRIFFAQSWTALFRAFSSHRQPSDIFSKVFPAEQTSWPNWQTLLACTEADV